MSRRFVTCLLVLASTTASAQAHRPRVAADSAIDASVPVGSVEERANPDTLAAARPIDPISGRHRPRWLSPDRLVLVAGASFASPQSAWLGRTPEREVYFSSVRLAWSVGRIFGAKVLYAIDLHPAVVLAGNPAKFIDAYLCEDYGDSAIVPATQSGPGYLPEFGRCAMHRMAFAGGVSPAGLVVQRPLMRRLSVSGELTLGGLLFTDHMPYPNGSKFNYLIGAGAALEFSVSPKTAAVVRYRLDHISNAGMGEFNPGLGTHSIHVGVSRALRVKPTGRNTR